LGFAHVRTLRHPSKSQAVGRGIPQQPRRGGQPELRRVTLLATSTPTPAPSAQANLHRPGRGASADRGPTWLSNYRRKVIATDSAAVTVAVVLAHVVAIDRVFRFGSGGPGDLSGWALSALVIGAWLLCCAIQGVWDADVLGTGTTEFRRILAASLAVFAVAGIVGYLTAAEIVRTYLLVAVPLGLLGVTLSHWVWRRRLVAQRRSGSHLRSVVAVGDPVAVAELCARLRDRPDAGYRVIGVCTTFDHTTAHGGPDGLEGFPVIGDLSDVGAVAVGAGASAIAVAGSSAFEDRVPELAWRLEGTGVRLLVAPEIADIAGARLQVRLVADLPLLRVSEPTYDGPLAVAKSSLDLTVATLAAIVLSPLMVLAAVSVLVADGGPILNHQQLVGRGGRVYSGSTFRCSPMGARARAANMSNRSPTGYRLSITPIGRLLRRTGLDETPLLWNVLRGQMSIVGPQPRTPGESSTRRLLVRPGMTGPWRISGRHDDPLADRARTESLYLQNWSAVGDLAIMGQTVAKILAGHDAR